MLSEKGCELVKGDKVHPVVQIDMSRVGNDVEFLWLGCTLVGVFAELPRMCIVTRDEQHGTRRNRFNVIERVEVHEFDAAGKRRVRRQFRRRTLGGVFAPGSAVEVIKLTLNSSGVLIQFMHGSACVFGLAARELRIALLCRLGDGFLPLFEGGRMPQPVTVGRTHVIHTDRRNRLHARVNFGGADDEAPAAANPKTANTVPVNEWPGAQKIDRSTEILGINIRQNNVAGLPLTLTPEGQIEGQGDESLVSQLLGIQICALFFDCAHWVPDNDCRIQGVLIQGFGNEESPGNKHIVLVFERNPLHGHLVALIEVVRPLDHSGLLHGCLGALTRDVCFVECKCRRCADCTNQEGWY